jgi:hypothetical protein
MKIRPFFWLAGIVTVGLSLRLWPLIAHWQTTPLFMDPDSWGYQALASNLLAGHGYSWEEQEPYLANVYRPPGLPCLLTALYSLTGISVPHAILLQILVSSLTIVATYILARQLGSSPGISLVAALGLAIEPVSIYYANLLLTEVYSALVVTLVMAVSARYVRGGRPVCLIGAGLLLAIGIIIHPVLVFAPLFVLALAFFSPRSQRLHGLGWGLAAALLAWFPMATWVVRNHIVADYFGVSCVTAVNLMKYKAASVLAELHGTTRELERDRLTSACEQALPPDATRGDRWRSWERTGMAILRDHPFIYAKVHVSGMALELLGPERDLFTRFCYGSDTIDPSGRVTDERICDARQHPCHLGEMLRFPVLLLQGTIVLAWLAGIVGLIYCKRWKLLAALLLPAAYVLILSGGSEASPRFRVIYTPMLCIIAAEGLQWITGRFGRSNRGHGIMARMLMRQSWLTRG